MHRQELVQETCIANVKGVWYDPYFKSFYLSFCSFLKSQNSNGLMRLLLSHGIKLFISIYSWDSDGLDFEKICVNTFTLPIFSSEHQTFSFYQFWSLKTTIQPWIVPFLLIVLYLIYAMKYMYMIHNRINEY